MTDKKHVRVIYPVSPVPRPPSIDGSRSESRKAEGEPEREAGIEVDDFERSVLSELTTPGMDLAGATELVIYLLARCRGTGILEGEDTGEVSKARAELRGELRKMGQH